jgi:succinate dehydrogenase (ubiquinone) cytochrome b560 subunit
MLRPAPSAAARFGQSATATSSASQDDFFAKNEKLKRPMSPWMIYRIQLTSLLSITHRGTGLGLGVLLYGWGIHSLTATNTNWAQTLEAISATVPSSLLIAVKVAAAWGVGYHAVNGVRHLAWDMGKGFTLKELYTSGYVVLAISFLIAAYAAAKS